MKDLPPSYLVALLVAIIAVAELSRHHPALKVEAFTLTSFKKPKHASVAILHEKVDDVNHDLVAETSERRRVLNGFATAFAAVVSSTYSTPAAFADEIKTMDMSLPTYDSINTLKSSDAERGLGVENPSPSSSSGGSSSGGGRKKKSSSSGGGGGGGGGNPLGSVLPSMNKSVTKKPKTPKSEGSSNKGSRSSSPASKDDDDSGIKTMDLSLPSYSDSAKTASKSVFSL